MSLSSDVDGTAEAISQPHHVKPEESEDAPSSLDVDDPQAPMQDRVLIRRSRKVGTRRKSDGTTWTVQNTTYDLSPDTNVSENHRTHDGIDRLAHPRPYFVDTPQAFIQAPFRPTQPQAHTFLTPAYSQPHAFIELKSGLTASEEESNCPHYSGLHHTWRRFVCIVGLSLVNLMCGTSVTLPTTALTAIAQGLNATGIHPFWIPGSFLLMGSLSQPLLMRLSHVLGCRPIILVGVSISTGMSLVSALLPGSIAQLIVSRSLAGIGFASVRSLTPLILAQLIHYNHKKWYETWPSQCFWLGASLGPLIGAVAVESLNWRTLFCIEAALGASGLALLSFLELRSVDGPTLGTNVRKIDYLGWIFFSIMVTVTATVLSQIKSTLVWPSWWIPVECAAALFSSVTWRYYVSRSDEPIIPVSVFKDRRATYACIAAFVQNALFSCVVYLLPILIGNVVELGAVECALQISSWALPTFAATLFVASTLNTWAGTTPHILLAGVQVSALAWISIVFGLGFTAQYEPVGQLNLAKVGALATGIGLGALTPALCTILQTVTTNDDETIHALPLYNFVGSLGLCFGIVIGITTSSIGH